METSFFIPANKALWWLAKWCDEATNLEHDFEDCQWIPVTALEDCLDEDNLTQLLQDVGQFSYEDIQKLNQL